MTRALDFIERHTPNDPRLLRALDFLLPVLVLAVLVIGIIQIGRVSDVAHDNQRNLVAQEDERSDRIYATNTLDEYFCGQIEGIKGAIEGILNAALAVPLHRGDVEQQTAARLVIGERLAGLEAGGPCKVRIPAPPTP